MSDTPTASAPSPSDPAPAASSTPSRKRPWTILGRLAKAVREQNWFAVVLELAIVVLGVVIGFQVTAWGQDRADRAQERAYLHQLVEDLQETEQSFRTMAPTWRRRDSTAAALLRSFRSESQPPADSVLGWMVVAVDIVRTSIVTGTADALVSTGDINLIRDDSLRSSITNYQDLMDQQQSQLAAIDEEARPHIISMVESVDIIEGMFSGWAPGRRDTMALSWYMSPVPVGDVRTLAPLDVDALFRDRVVYSAISQIWRLRVAIMRNRQSTLEATVALREQIEAELSP